MPLFAPWLRRWNLTADGETIVTRNNRLLPVRRDGVPAMLVITETAAVELARI
jgi:streptomycin 6-kinase